MKKTVLNDVFELLQQIGAVSSESEKRVKTSVATFAMYAIKLQHFGRSVPAKEADMKLGNRFIEHSEQCHKLINANAGGGGKMGQGSDSNTITSVGQSRHLK
jgi:histidinol-phosphate/aromatic aminotransferase/cobyric acid decarboxylase-like protein